MGTMKTYQKKEIPAKVMVWGLTLLVIGAVLGGLSLYLDKTRGLFNYLISFMFLISIGVGALFWMALEYVSGAVWSTPIRRMNEFLSGSIPFFVLFALPLLFFGMHSMYHWTHHEAVMNDPILQGKAPYLNMTFFVIRNIIYFVVWLGFYIFFTQNSKKQDLTQDQANTHKGVVGSAIFLPLFALTLSFCAIDWMMSLEPHWFSTIYGVYYFAGTVVSSMAAITIATVLLHENGYLHPSMTRHTYYSLGSYLFGFTVFWAYIAFCQFMLIWYANLPEETYWYLDRWQGSWKGISYAMIIIHFVVPFFGLLSKPAKLNPNRLIFFSVWILVAHFIDLYYLVMPTYTKSINMKTALLGWQEIVFPIAAVGFVIVVFCLKSKKANFVPIGDPKLARGLHFHS